MALTLAFDKTKFDAKHLAETLNSIMEFDGFMWSDMNVIDTTDPSFKSMTMVVCDIWIRGDPTQPVVSRILAAEPGLVSFHYDPCEKASRYDEKKLKTLKFDNLQYVEGFNC